jgi:hypothetical protein
VNRPNFVYAEATSEFLECMCQHAVGLDKGAWELALEAYQWRLERSLEADDEQREATDRMHETAEEMTGGFISQMDAWE